MTKECKSCQKNIDLKENKCPHCGAYQGGWFSRSYVLIGIMILIIFLALLGGIKHFTSLNQEQAEETQPTPTTVRHDNSGAGANTQEDNSGENHFNRALQHFGL